jgi:hypothetical protein
MSKGAPTSIGNCSGMSKLADARKKCPPPVAGGKTEYTIMSVSGAGKSKPGAPTLNARKVQPKAKEPGKSESTMIGKGKK